MITTPLVLQKLGCDDISGDSIRQDEERFLRQFERCELPVEEFDHQAHIYMAYLYLKRYSLLHALAKIDSGLRALIDYFGAQSRYHKTITLATSLLIYERMMQQDQPSFTAFKAAHPDLFTGPHNPLHAFYDQDALERPDMRHEFQLPVIDQCFKVSAPHVE